MLDVKLWTSGGRPHTETWQRELANVQARSTLSSYPCPLLTMTSNVPARARFPSAIERKLLKQLGRQLSRIRRARKLPASMLAAEIGISRRLLKAAEGGDASVMMGTILSIFAVLVTAEDSALVGAGVDPVAVELAKRHTKLEAQVAAGTRDAQSLVLIPAELALRARVTFPKDAFGEPQPW